jgi:hypothetical protein
LVSISQSCIRYLLFLRGFGCVIVVLQSPFASINYFVRYLAGFLRVHFEDQYGIGVKAVHDPPIMLRVSNSQRSATCANIPYERGVGHAQLLSFLKQPKQLSGLLPSFDGKRRILDLAM